MKNAQVLIAGAGSVGLMLANLLGRAGIRTTLIDRKTSVEKSSKAIGISPVSLEIFKKIGLEKDLIAAGSQVETVRVFGSRKALGRLDFSRIDCEHHFVLSLPQGETEALLDRALGRFPCVEVLRGWEVVSVENTTASVSLHVKNLASGEVQLMTGEYLAACDGAKSFLRTAAGIGFRGSPYRDTFLMGDFKDDTGWGQEARLFFTRHGSVESFPLPGGLRRYVLSTPSFVPENTGPYLVENIEHRIPGHDLRQSGKIWESAFGVQHYLAESYNRGRLFLAGDAAHVMSPIVGQNMNTGFADAELLAALWTKALADPPSGAKLFPLYEKFRKRAARSATFRAWFMMRLATGTGSFWSSIRNAAVALVLHTPLASFLPRLFSMDSIPFANLNKAARHPSVKDFSIV